MLECSRFEKNTAMLVRLAQTITSKYYTVLFLLNLIITIIVISLYYSTVCSDVVTVLHQARRFRPIADY